MKREQLGEILVRWGAIDARQLKTALERHRAQGGRLGEALLALGYCSEAQVYAALAEQFDMPFVDLDVTPPTPGAIRLIPRAEAKRLGVVPVRVEDGRLVAVARNAFDFHLDTEVRELARRPVLLACGVPSQINGHLESYGVTRNGMTLQAAERFSLVNRQMEQALQGGAGRIRLEIEGGTVRVCLVRAEEDREVARVPVDRLQVFLDKRKAAGLYSPHADEIPVSVRFGQW